MIDLGGQLGFERGGLWPVAVGVGAVLLWWGWWGYALPRRGSGRAKEKVLPVLRVLALSLVVICIPGPVWRRAASVEERGVVDVLVDTSLSMSVVDSQRSPSQRLRIGETLGLWKDPEGEQISRVRDEFTALDAAAESVFRARAELDAVELTRRDPAEARKKLSETRASLENQRDKVLREGIPEAAKAAVLRVTSGAGVGSRGWRFESFRAVGDARRAWESGQDARLDELVRTDPKASLVSTQVGQMSRAQLAMAVMNSKKGGLLARLPEGTRVRWYNVDVGAAGVEASQLAGRVPTGTGTDLGDAITTVLGEARGGGPRAILLLTDGRVTGGPARLEGVSVPVLAVNVAPEVPPPVFVVRKIDAPGSLVVGQAAKLRVAVEAMGLEGATTVKMLSAGQTQVRPVKLRSGGGITNVEFDLLAEKAGDLAVEVVLDPPEGQVTMASQRVRRIIRVLGERPRVMFLASQEAPSSWDAQLLRMELARTSWLRLVEPESADEVESRLTGVDSVIIANLPPSELGLEARESLRDLVARRGGSMLLLPGREHLPAQWSDDDDLASYLPAETWNWRVSPAAEGEYAAVPAEGVVELGDSATWSARARLFRVVIPDQTKPASDPLLVDRVSGIPILTEMSVGSGRVLMLGTDQAWRWQVESAIGASEVWQPILRRLVDLPYAISAMGDGKEWSLDAVVNSGRVIDVRIRGISADGSPLRAGAPALVLIKEGRELRSVAARQVSAGHYVARFEGLSDGEYVVQLDGPISPRATVRIGDDGEVELSDLSGDQRGLERLANSTGGAAFAVTDLARLAQAIADAPRREGAVIVVRVWDSPVLLLVIVSLLSAEWALRKQWGLA